nr:HAD-IA family hydrolase [Pigmentibacter ruber]
MKNGVIFDLDGTLIDTPAGIVEGFLYSLKCLNYNNVSVIDIRNTIGLPLEKAFASLLNVELENDLISLAIKNYHKAFNEIVLPKAKKLIFPGVIEGLTNLKEHGYILAIATSKYLKSANNLLSAAELLNYFDLIVGADLVQQAKPHPEMGLFVIEKLQLDPKNSFMIGDTTHDLLMAKDAGLRGIGVTYGIHDKSKLETAEPELISDNFNNVIQYILKQN